MALLLKDVGRLEDHHSLRPNLGRHADQRDVRTVQNFEVLAHTALAHGSCRCSQDELVKRSVLSLEVYTS